MLNRVIVEARDLPDLWFQAIYNILKHGRKFTINRGSYEKETRLEFDYFMGHVKHPGTLPLLPEIPPLIDIPAPVEHDYVYGGKAYERSYIEYIMTDTMEPNEVYTYGQRLVASVIPKNIIDNWSEKKINNTTGIFSKEDKNKSINHCLNQVEFIIDTYKKYGHRNNQLVLQIAQPTDLLLSDPPCLRSIDTRIQDNKLHFFVYFRSWDLWGGMPANLAGIQELKKYMADEIGVEDGEMIVESKGLHIYGYAEEFAKIRCMVEK